MLKNFNKFGIILYGPPGSGKGTQAKLLADKFGFFHFDTGEFLRKIVHDPELQKNKVIQRERKINGSGALNTPSWVLKIVKEAAEKSAGMEQGIVFSGSPRTFYEAFGYGEGQGSNDEEQDGLIKTLENCYSKENITIFL